jgi:hypothetical protein
MEKLLEISRGENLSAQLLSRPAQLHRQPAHLVKPAQPNSTSRARPASLPRPRTLTLARVWAGPATALTSRRRQLAPRCHLPLPSPLPCLAETENRGRWKGGAESRKRRGEIPPVPCRTPCAPSHRAGPTRQPHTRYPAHAQRARVTSPWPRGSTHRVPTTLTPSSFS